MGFLQKTRLILAYVLVKAAEVIAGDLSDEAESPVVDLKDERQTPGFVEPIIAPVVRPTARALEMLAEGRPQPIPQKPVVEQPLKGSLRARGIR